MRHKDWSQHEIGGTTIGSVRHPGHTRHSTAFLLAARASVHMGKGAHSKPTCPDTADPSMKVMRRSCSSWNAPNSYEGRLLQVGWAGLVLEDGLPERRDEWRAVQPPTQPTAQGFSTADNCTIAPAEPTLHISIVHLHSSSNQQQWQQRAVTHHSTSILVLEGNCGEFFRPCWNS